MKPHGYPGVPSVVMTRSRETGLVIEQWYYALLDVKRGQRRPSVLTFARAGGREDGWGCFPGSFEQAQTPPRCLRQHCS